MTGQHTGRLSDSIDHEEGGVQRLMRVVKPSGKVYRGGATTGNGDFCSVDGHGKMIVLSSGRQWCPDQSHDNERITKGA